MIDEEGGHRTTFRRLGDRILEARRLPPKRFGYVAAVLLFLATGVVGVVRLPPRTDGVRPLLLVIVALLLGPATSACNAAEYALTVRYAGRRVRMLEAVRVAVLSTAANLLPIPGSVLVRAAGLRRLGASSPDTARVLLAASGMWLGATSILTGVGMVAGRVYGAAAAVLIVAGVAAVAVAHQVFGASRRPGAVGLTAALFGVEAATVAIGAFRLWLCMRALGYDTGVVKSTALTFASVLANAVGVFPGGLGLREALAAAIGPLVALPAAVAATASAVDRLLGLPVVLVSAAGFAVTSGRSETGSVEPQPPARQ